MTDINKELAARTLARRSLLAFVKRFRPKYDAGWVHQDICRRLERFVHQVEQGLEPRLLLAMPVRHGKSELGSRHFAPWVLGKHPEWEIIAASGAQSLAMSFSRYIRDLVRDPAYQSVFENMRLDPSSQSVENWNTTYGGGYLAAGIGTMITGRGAHCLPLSQQVVTDSGLMTLESLLKDNEKVHSVLSYEGDKLSFRRINAFVTRTSDHFYRIKTSTGTFEATGEHPVCVAFSKTRPVYRRVDDLRAGESLVVVDRDASDAAARCGYVMPGVWHPVHEESVEAEGSAASVRSAKPHLFDRLHGGGTHATTPRHAFLRRVWGAVHAGIIRVQTAVRTWGPAPFLFDGLHWQTSFAGICWGKAPSLLAGGSSMHSVQGDIPQKEVGSSSVAYANAVLQQGLLRSLVNWSPYPEGYRTRLAEVLPARVQEDTKNDVGTRGDMRGVWCSGEGLASQGRKPGEQQAEQLGCGMPGLPHRAPHGFAYSQIIEIERVEESLVVCDIEVEGAHNFVLSSGNLLLNCLILDDPVKDAEAADSQIIRDSVWEWYMSTALTRLAPGGGVLGIMTLWNEDDWAGRIQQVMATGDGDKFEIVKYPAINEHGDEYILPDDSIAQFPPGTTPPEGSRLTRLINSALHPARYTLEMLLKRKANYYALGQQRWWSALYQQNPSPEDGAFFTKDMFIEYVHAPQRHGRIVYQAWDFAITEKQKSDYTVAITGLVDEYDNMYILDVWRFKTDDGIELGTAIMQYSRTWNADLIAVEDGQIWKSIKSNFDKACEVAKHYPSYEVIVPLTDKRTRAQPARGRMQQGKIQFPSRAPWYPEYKAEMLRFQAGGKHDDVVDATAHLVRLATAQAAPKGPPAPKMPQSWKSKLMVTLRGAGGSHMAA